MTGTGAYFYIVWGIWLRHHLNYRQNEYELVWPNFWTVPEVVRRGSSAKNAANGSVKKEL
jgi:dihydroceramidase